MIQNCYLADTIRDYIQWRKVYVELEQSLLEACIPYVMLGVRILLCTIENLVQS